MVEGQDTVNSVLRVILLKPTKRKEALIKALGSSQGQKRCTCSRICASTILARPNPSEQIKQGEPVQVTPILSYWKAMRAQDN